MMNIRQFIYKYLWWTYRPIKSLYKEYKTTRYNLSEIDRVRKESKQSPKRIFYLGITAHSNLGDMGQHYCIKKWITENYSNSTMIMLESSVITNPATTKDFFDMFKTVFDDANDRIVFQSGYCTQDLGGDHPLMHRLVCEQMKNAKILMMPQTIYFQHEENRKICSVNHNKAKNMLFLARDMVSYEQAKDMFPDIRVEAFPDIVTTLIGTLSFQNKRDGVCLCTRNDGEKLYDYKEIEALKSRLESDGISVFSKDTQGKQSYKEIRANLQSFIEAEIESYSHFKVTITDRYHGTIFSLCAGTPVIIIKTTDHKVTTGADWFKGVYDDYVFVAENLGDAFDKCKELLYKNLDNKLSPYFKVQYYDKLKSLFENNSFVL